MNYSIQPTTNRGTHTLSDGSFVNVIPAEKVLTLKQFDTVEADSLADLERSEGLNPCVRRVAPPRPTKVPQTLPHWRAKVVLEDAGLYKSIPDLLLALPEPDRTWALAAWDGKADFLRNGPTVRAAGAALGLTEEQIDAMFIAAVSHQV